MLTEVIIPPSKKLEDLIRLAELCVDLLRQNEEFYAEVRQTFIQFHPHSTRKRKTRKVNLVWDFHGLSFDLVGRINPLIFNRKA